MAEPTTITTLAVATLSIPLVTAFGIPLGLRTDVLIAGLAGSLVSIVLLNAVPSTGDTWKELLKTSIRRMAVACASSLTAGYLTPLAMLFAVIPESLLLGTAFAVGAGAQQVLMFAIQRIKGNNQLASKDQP